MEGEGDGTDGKTQSRRATRDPATLQAVFWRPDFVWHTSDLSSGLITAAARAPTTRANQVPKQFVSCGNVHVRSSLWPANSARNVGNRTAAFSCGRRFVCEQKYKTAHSVIH
ncbi:hypothetical protein BaRGS_00031047 [Batillaria attramentaria]|uniref:C2H2-type domain-containing protein n=1 Tax=Batillaria attramentaria TaxID=370345 RepID=A0ABD0JS61_9CAEN